MKGKKKINMLIDVSALLNRLVKGPEGLSPDDLAKTVEIKQAAKDELESLLREKGVDPSSLIIGVDPREVIALDNMRCCIVISVRPKGFLHVPIKGKPYDKGHITLMTRVTEDKKVSWSNLYFEALLVDIFDPVKWTRE